MLLSEIEEVLEEICVCATLLISFKRMETVFRLQPTTTFAVGGSVHCAFPGTFDVARICAQKPLSHKIR